MLLKLMLNLASLLLTPIIALLNFAGIDFADILAGVNALLQYIVSGFDIVFFFVPKTVCMIAVNICLLLEEVYLAYCIMMWIYRKIPFLGGS